MRIFLIIFLAVCTYELQAQVTAGRQTFSSGGTVASGTNVNASSTLGEAITGKGGSSIIATQGFQQSGDSAVTHIETPWGDQFDIAVFPNPTVDHITLSLTGVLNEPVDIQLFDASGRAISGWNFSIRQSGDKQMSTESLAKGVYFLRFSQNNGGKVHSLRIMRR